jgi:tRNA A-37 threonylcarbamoyl transferase component Bud32
MITCQYCGANNPTGASFCDGCGAALTTKVAAQAQATAQAQVAAAHSARAQQATAQHSAVHANPQFGTGRLPPQTMLRKQYLILRTIGRGGMAAVYQASDTKSNRVVAIKEMSQDNLTPEEQREAIESFESEAALLQKLKQANLPHVYTYFSEQNRHYLVMDYIDGETLEQKLVTAKGPLREADVLRWARQLCAALAYLHAQKPPIIFRDLKPANVMVTKKGEVKLIDFGIARHFKRGQTKDTQALGTPGYAPPEQYGNSQTDERADIYALGATLFHLLTNYDVGRTPFALPPLRSRNSAISERTASAIEKATRLDRADRYRTIGEFAQALGVGAKATAYTAPQPAAARPRPTQAQQAQATRQRPTAAQAPGAQAQRSPVNSALDAAWRAAAAGIVAGGAAALHAQMNPQSAKSPGAAFRDAAIAAARTATGPGSALVTQPREIQLGQLRAGQDGSASVTISRADNAPINGTLKPLSPWLHLDRTSFSGASSLIQVTARTSEMHSAGPQRGTIEVAVGNQRMYIPVRVDVIAAPQPRPAAPRPAAPRPQPASPPLGAFGGPLGRAPAAAPQGGNAAAAAAAQPTVQRPAVRNPFAGAAGGLAQQTRSLGGLRVALSLALALLLAFGLPILLAAVALPQLAAQLPSPAIGAWALLLIGVIGALVGAPLAYVGSTAGGRIRTSVLLGGAGAALAVAYASQLGLTATMTQTLPAAAQVGSLALTLPLFVAVGAAIGAQPLISRGIMAVARYVAVRYWMAQILAAIVGGWLGLTIAQTALSAAFQQPSFATALVSGCGLIVGVALGVLLASPVGALVRRFAFG